MADGDKDVLSSLPRTRPERRSSKRAAPTATAKAPAKAARKPKNAKPAARSRPAPKAAPKAVPRKVPPAGYAVPKHTSPVGSGGAELVSTAVQALGELANLGGRALRDALGRLPRP